MITNVTKGDYIIGLVGSKFQLIQVSSVSQQRKMLRGMAEGTKAGDDPEPVKLMFSDVSALLGPDPKQGTVFGVKVEPYRGSTSTPMGRLDFHRVLSGRERKYLMGALKKVYGRCKGTKVQRLFPLDHIEIRPHSGKYAGMYKHKRNSLLSDNHDYMILRPEVFDPELVEYYVWHEVAHGVWFHMVPQKAKAQWIQMYARKLHLSELREDTLGQVLVDIEKEGSIGGYLTTVEDEEKLVVREVLKHIKRVHRLTKENLELLMYQGKTLEPYWPSYYELSEPSVIDVSEYAMKSVEEFFAEVMGWTKVGRKMPKAIQSLFNKTMGNLVA